jgi:hypothetical protein
MHQNTLLTTPDFQKFLTYLILYLEVRYSFFNSHKITISDYFQNITIDQSTIKLQFFSSFFIPHLTVLCVENLFGTTIIFLYSTLRDNNQTITFSIKLYAYREKHNRNKITECEQY